MSGTIEYSEEIENEILKFIDSININEIKKDDIDRIATETKRLFNDTTLSKCNELTLRKFIKLSIHLIKYFHKALVEELSKFQRIEENESKDLENSIEILDNLCTPIQNISDESIEFCNYFHEEESENGIKVLFDLVMDEKLISVLKESPKSKIGICLKDFLLNNPLLNISKAHDKYKEKWNNLNAYEKFLDLRKKTHNKKLKLTYIMILGNIASDEDLNNFSASPTAVESLTKQIQRISSALVEKSYLNGNEFKRELFQIEEGKEKVEIIHDEKTGWNLFECLQALYKFSINDKLKIIIYETFSMKETLRKIVFDGNETEQEYAFKVLNQLVFDKYVASDILNDKDLIKFMNEIIMNKKDQNNLIKTVNAILWLINKKEEKEIKSEDIKKHIFISYNSQSRSICLPIKSFLESIGFKCWIDVENIHGSSIDAMATGIETASCVLICMTENYKESNNCRMEAEYTIQKQKPFIPLILQKSYRPDGWLGFILGSKIYIDYTKYSFEECSSRLQKELKNFHDSDTPSTTIINNKPIDKKEIVKNRNLPKQILASNWSQD